MNNKEQTDKHFHMIQESYYIIGNFINSTTFTDKEKREIVNLWTKILLYKPYKQFLAKINEKSDEINKAYMLNNIRGIEC